MKAAMRRSTEDSHSLKNGLFWPIAGLIILNGLVFRLHGIGARSLWIDELYSQWFASRPFIELWRDVPTYETHPPTYYIILKLWTSFAGDSEIGLRSLSLLASLLTIASVALLPRLLRLEIISEKVGLFAAALLSVNFANIRDAQNARPYALQTLVCTLAILAALILVSRLNRNDDETHAWRSSALLLGLFGGLLLWLHNTGMFITLGIWSGLGLSLVVLPPQRRLQGFKALLATGLLAIIVWSPYMPVFFTQSIAFKGLAFWLEPKVSDLYSAWFLLLGESWPALCLALLLLVLGLFQLARRSLSLASFAAAVLLIPLYVMLAISFSMKPVYIQRLFAWMIPLGLVVIAYGVMTLGIRWYGKAALALIAVSFAVVVTMRDAERPIDDWKAIVGEIASHSRPNDVVVAVAAEGSIALDYYASQRPGFPPIVCVPGCYPQRHLPRKYISNLGAPVVIGEDQKIVDEVLKTYGRVWLVQVSVALYDPKGIVRSRIAKGRTFVRYYGNALARVDLFE